MSIAPLNYFQRLIQKMPIPVMALVAGVLVGVAVWVVIDRFQNESLRKIFDEALENQLHQQARESLIRFGEYRNSIALNARMLANHKRMAHYLDPVWWPDTPREAKRHDDIPDWLPETQHWQSGVMPSHMMLTSPEAHIQEIYLLRGDEAPADFRNDVALYVGESQHQALLTKLGGQPFLIVSEPIEDNSSQDMGHLVIIVPLDSSFLIASQQAVKAEQSIVAIMDSESQLILSSSDEKKVSQGVGLEALKLEYVITAQSFFDYEDFDFNLLFATLLPRSVFKQTGQKILELERRQRLYGAGIIIGVFILFFVVISSRLNRLLARISEFSLTALGIPSAERKRGNQLFILEEWIREFIQLVLKAREDTRERHVSEIRETEELRAAIMATSLDSIITIDEQDEIIDYNPTAQATFGYLRENALGAKVADLIIAPRSKADFQKHLITCLTAGDWAAEPERNELYALHQDGKEFPVELAIKSILLEDNLLFTIYIHNISERRRQESVIRSLAVFPSESPIPVMRINRQGVILYANVASQGILDFWGTYLSQTLPILWRKRISQVLLDGENRELELTTDGIIYSVLLAPISDFSYVNLYARDITKMRQAEEVAQQRQNELIHVSRLSTMGEMATGIAHELNQPLSAIVNFSNGSLRRIRSDTGSKDDIVGALDQITSQASRAGEIIKRMRSLVTKQPSLREQVDLNTLVLEVGALLTHDVRKKHIKLDYHLFDGELLVNVDSVQIEQVLLNIIRNASDSLEAKPIDNRSLCISSHILDDKIVISIVDNGAGISPEVKSHLFDPFYSTKQEGMGMGLAISKTIVDDHGGQIYANSLDGSGTEFVIELPTHIKPMASIAL